MRPSRVVLLLWSTLIVVLLVVEIAELTRSFTLPIQSAIGDPLAFVIVLFFTTAVALVGAVFIGIYISSRMMRPTGFTPFEEEMLRMRKQLQNVERSVEEIRHAVVAPDPKEPEASSEKEPP